jgi:hypothetical protein
MLLRTVNCINFSIKRILHGGANGKYFPVYFSVSHSLLTSNKRWHLSSKSIKFLACILKAHSHLKEWRFNLSSPWVPVLFLNCWRVSVAPYYATILTHQLFKNSIDTQGKLRLNLHSLSVSELLEYRDMSANVHKFQKFTISIYYS